MEVSTVTKQLKRTFDEVSCCADQARLQAAQAGHDPVFMSAVGLPICQPQTIAVHEPPWNIVAPRAPVNSR